MSNYRSGYDKTARTWIGILAVFMVLVIALAVVLGVMTKGFTDWSMFGGEEQQEQTDESGDESGEANMQEDMLVSEGENNGFKLMSTPYMVTNEATGLAEVAGQTVTVSNPEDVATYAWTLSWAGTGDVNDYVTLSGTTGTSVTVTCLQAFGSQITLTCTASILDTEVSSATVTIDYKKRITGMTLNGVTVTDGGEYELDDFYDGDKTLSQIMKTNGFVFDYQPVMSAGTVDPDAEGYVPLLEATVEGSQLQDTSTFQKAGTADFNEVFFGTMSGNASYKDQFANGTIDPMMAAFFQMTTEDAVFTVKLGASFTSESGDGFSKEVTVKISFPTEWVAQNYDVALDKGNIIF